MKQAPFVTPPAAGQPQSRALEFALDVVETLADSDHLAVPVKPTPTMLAAGAKAGGVSVITVWKIYQAMMEAL